MALEHLDTELLGAGRQVGAVALGAQIDDGGNPDALGQQIQRRHVAIGIRRQHHRVVHRLDAVAVDETLRGRREHDPGKVVVAEYGRLFVGATSHQHGARAEFGHAFRIDQRDPVIGIPTCRQGAGPYRDIRQRGQLRFELTKASERVVVAAALVAERATDARVLVDQHDFRASARSGQCRHQARRPCSHHQQVGEVIALRRAYMRCVEFQPPQTGDATEQPLPERKQGLRLVERLVIEAHRQQPAEPAEQACAIGFDPAVGVDRGEIQPGLERLHVGPQIEPRARLHQRVDIVIGHRQQTARAVVLEAATEDAHAGGPQRARWRVAVESGKGLAFEGESEPPGPVDPFASDDRQPSGRCRGGGRPDARCARRHRALLRGGGHAAFPSAAGGWSPGSQVRRTRSVTVSRSA